MKESARLLVFCELMIKLIVITCGRKDGTDHGVLEGGDPLIFVNDGFVGELVVAGRSLNKLPLVIQHTSLTHFVDDLKNEIKVRQQLISGGEMSDTRTLKGT